MGRVPSIEPPGLLMSTVEHSASAGALVLAIAHAAPPSRRNPIRRRIAVAFTKTPRFRHYISP